MATTKDTFDQIAESWYRLRHYPRFRKELEEIAQRWQGGKLLNIGCAHGPDFLPFRNSFELTGVDISAEMLRLARRYAKKFDFEVNLITADACLLPCRKNSFDWVISIATYHHVSEVRQREIAFQELWRILNPGGEAFITVWNRRQPRFWFQPKELEVPWRLKSETLYRHYYLFSYPELKKLLTKVGFEVLRIFPESSYRLPLKTFSQNICVLIKKPPE